MRCIENKEPEELNRQDQDEQNEVREPRTFAGSVERTNIAFLVSMSPKEVEQFAKGVDALLEAAGGRLIFVKGPTPERLFIEKARPRFDRDDDRRDDRDDRRDRGDRPWHRRTVFGGQ